MKKIMSFINRMFLPLIILVIIQCNFDKKPGVIFFKRAEAIWPVGKQYEKNITAGFRAQFEKPVNDIATLKVTGSSLYRVFLNGEFIGHGPARAAHDYYRMDEWDLSGKMSDGKNVLAIEVAGYNINTYYLLDQPSFIKAELVSGKRVIAATSANTDDFKAVIVNQRVQKVPRYSYQRTFIEYYKLEPGYDNWMLLKDDELSFVKNDELSFVKCESSGKKALLTRNVPYPEFKVRIPVKVISTGEVKTGIKRENYWRDRSLTNISEKYKGFVESELTLNPAIELQEMENIVIDNVEASFREYEGSLLAQDNYKIFDFGINLTGFIGGEIEVTRAGRLFITFDEILTEEDVNFRRMGAINCITYDLVPGTYRIESIEPYTLKYLKAIMTGGECVINKIYLREYVNPDVNSASFESSDPRINRIFRAGVETFRQNATDVFMDCPSRERASWLHDSYWTARVALDISGNTLIERNFFENFLLPEKFESIPEGMIPMIYPADHNLRDERNFIPNFAMWFIIQLEEYLNRSNDRELIDDLRIRVLDLMSYFESFKNEDGLLEKLDGWMLIEWSEANKFVQDIHYPTNMLFAATLDAVGKLYGLENFIKEASAIRETIREQAFNGEFFVDNAERNHQGELVITKNTTESCQYFAFYFDIATPDSHPELWGKLVNEFGPKRKIKNPFPEVHFAAAYAGNYLRLELLSRYNLRSQLLDESIDFFDYMALRTGTLWEHISPTASLNHGFAAHVVHVLYRDVLGITEIDLINKKIHLRIPNIDLSFCKGTTPRGKELFEFEWKKDGEIIYFRHNVPDNFDIDIQNDTRYKILNW